MVLLRRKQAKGRFDLVKVWGSSPCLYKGSYPAKESRVVSILPEKTKTPPPLPDCSILPKILRVETWEGGFAFSAEKATAVAARHRRPVKSRLSNPPSKEKYRRTLRCNGIFGGGRWIRTTEVSDNRFTVCPLWPLGNSPIFNSCCVEVGAGRRTRTPDLLITNQLLYQLSYTSIAATEIILTETLGFVKSQFVFFRRNFCILKHCPIGWERRPLRSVLFAEKSCLPGRKYGAATERRFAVIASCPLRKDSLRRFASHSERRKWNDLT